MKPPAFQLEPRRWYALTLFFAGHGEEHRSPIYVREIRPLKSGQGVLEVSFFHANYAEGVQDKVYRLRVVHRAPGYLAALRVDEADPTHQSTAHLIVLTEISLGWVRAYFPSLRFAESDPIQQALSRELLSHEAG